MNEAVERAQAAIADLQVRPAWAASDTEAVALIDATHTLITRLTAIAAAHVHELDARGYPRAQGATSASTWLRDRLRISVHAARRLIALGKHMQAHPALADAVALGEVTAEQAAVIDAALADLPDEAGIAIAAECETALLAQAHSWEPGALATIGERILALVAPDVADEALRRSLDRDEHQAHRARGFTLTDQGHGGVRVSGSLDVEAATIVRAALEPLCRPAASRRHDGGAHPDVDVDEATRDLRLPAQRRADALVEVCRLVLAGTELPDNGGDRPQITLTLDYDTLTKQVTGGALDTGAPLTPTALRRLGCDAGVIPSILRGPSEVLELGRARRLFTGPIRRALILRDRGCAFPGCDRPPRWTDGHHIVSWLDGGSTDLNNGVLLCRRHHRAVHHDGWTVRLATDGIPEFIPPTYIDPLQRPRRNLIHRRC